MYLENGEISPWILLIIIVSSLILLLSLFFLFVFGLRLCDYNHNVWGILLLFITFNIVGLIIGILIISYKNKKVFEKLKELGVDYKNISFQYNKQYKRNKIKPKQNTITTQS